MITLPRETLEFIPVNITVDGVPVTAGVKVCVTPGTARPTVWDDPVVLGDEIGVMTTDHTPGTYRVWAQITSSPEIVVVECGTFELY